MSTNEIHTLKYWVQKVLPLVYDDSLSYYELLSKVVYKINEIIDNSDGLIAIVQNQTEKLETLIVEVEDLVNGRFDELVESYIEEAIKNVWFGLTDSGYFVAYIPDSWDDITFNTSGYDINIPQTSEYGHLVLSY